ncbi:MAG: hypothetical protein AAFX79_09035 [Planctomycetota bacterium]
MASAFASTDLFGSGPHRFVVLEQGQAELPPGTVLGQQGQPVPQWIQLGLMPLSIAVRGRLVAASESALWLLRDAITGLLTASPTSGTLEDHGGQQWADMELVGYRELGPVDRGRRWTIGYEAVFRAG